MAGETFTVLTDEEAARVRPVQELSAGSPNALRFNPNREAGLMSRFAGGFKMTEDGRKGYLEEANTVAGGVGANNVMRDTDGALYVIDRKNNEIIPYNKPADRRVPLIGVKIPNAGDIAGFAGDALAAVPAMLSRNPVVAGVLSAFGRGGKQVVSEMLPGDDGMTLKDRGVDLAIAGATGAGAQGVANLGARTIDAVRPHNLAVRGVQTAVRSLDPAAPPNAVTPFARHGAQLANRSGVDLSLGQQTGHRGVLMLEGLVRQHPMTADRMFQGDMLRMQQSLGYLDRTMQTIAPGNGGPVATGTSVFNAFDRALRDAVTTRRRAADRDFALVDQVSGGSARFGMDRTVAAIDDLIAHYDVPGGGDASSATVNSLRQVAAQLRGTANQPTVNGREMNRLLQIWGGASRGTGRVFTDLDRAQERMIAGRVFEAMEADLDNAVQVGGPRGGQNSQRVAEALVAARDNYRNNSTFINELGNSVLGRMFNSEVPQTATDIAEKMLRLNGEELTTSFQILDRTNPQAAQQVKRLFLEESLTKAGHPRSANAPLPEVGGQVVFSTKQFAEHLRKSPVWDVLNQQEREELNIAVRVFERLNDRAGMQGSQTAPLQFTKEVAKALIGNPVDAAQAIASVWTSRRMADVLLDPIARRNWMILNQTGAGTEQAGKAAAYLAAMIATEDEPGHGRAGTVATQAKPTLQ